MDVLGTDIWGIVKIMVLVGFALYIIFAFVVVRQITHMTKTLRVGFETPIRLLGVLHFVASIILFIFALMVL